MMNAMDPQVDFYEEDEDPGKIQAAFDRARKRRTRRPVSVAEGVAFVGNVVFGAQASQGTMTRGASVTITS